MSRPKYPLNPTPNRLALLRAVADGAVTEVYNVGVGWNSLVDQKAAGWHWRGRSRYRKVTVAVNDLYRVGWIRPLRRAKWMGTFEDRPWEITGNGKAVLDAFEEPEVPDA